jgi:hypothetical protein
MVIHGLFSATGSSDPACCTGGGRIFRKRLLLMLIPMVLLGFSACATEEKVSWLPPAPPEPVDQNTDPRIIVERALDFMGDHQNLAFEALVTYEAIQENGQKFHFDMLQRVAVQRPEQLFWMTLFDDASTQMAWCNRGEFTLLKQPANIWGRIIVSPTIDDAVSRISEEYNIDVPFVDILSGDPAELWLGEDVQSVDYVDPAWIEGYWTDHIAIRKPGIDFELWFRQGDEPFPMRIELVYTTEPQMPSYSARFKKWSTTVDGNDIN